MAKELPEGVKRPAVNGMGHFSQVREPVPRVMGCISGVKRYFSQEMGRKGKERDPIRREISEIS
ncbi:MAG: hypothetical protein KKG02_02330 [Candidatus Edwardsbacteria bacterium]|nr:hypothetical protein [Candidatus Edwardsbacteria bacterium]MBU2464586.1 hypothetical protein [Candidatus Edwardsbacteria bacterium]MBU2593368.1 hypothetical protein [Candidatus Edwardsbacteria bacterium]